MHERLLCIVHCACALRALETVAVASADGHALNLSSPSLPVFVHVLVRVLVHGWLFWLLPNVHVHPYAYA